MRCHDTTLLELSDDHVMHPFTYAVKTGWGSAGLWRFPAPEIKFTRLQSGRSRSRRAKWGRLNCFTVPWALVGGSLLPYGKTQRQRDGSKRSNNLARAREAQTAWMRHQIS